MPLIFRSPDIKVVRTHVLGKNVLFAVDQPRDTVQKHHLKGRFYEADELLLMSQVFPKGGRFLDIGANVGNHLLFFGCMLDASYILPIEVNPRVLQLLRTNIMLNGLEEVTNTSLLGFGFDNSATDEASIRFREKNIGGARVRPSGGELQLVRGEDVIDEPFDLVKIDVEGAELRVLEGLEQYTSKYRPTYFIEVDNKNAAGFQEWLTTANYRVVDQYQRYSVNINYLVAPT